MPACVPTACFIPKHWAPRPSTPASVTSAACRPSTIASTTPGASNVSCSTLPQIPALDLLRRGHLADRGIPPLVEQPLPPERPRQRLQQRRIRAGLHRRRRCSPVGVTIVFRPGRRRIASGTRTVMLVARSRRRPRSTPRSRTRLASPSTRSRMSAPPGPTSTRSTSSRTIRARSAGNSSSHSGSSSLQRVPHLRLGQVRRLGPRRQPGAHDDLRLPQQRPDLVHHRRLDLGRRHPAHERQSWSPSPFSTRCAT